jgi:hypothetical protein
MRPTSETQEFARRFNEGEAIWRRFQAKRLTRHLLETDSKMPESILDRLEWLEAEREIRITRAVNTRDGFHARFYDDAQNGSVLV